MSERLPLEKRKKTGDQKVDGLMPQLFNNWKKLLFVNCIEQSPGIKYKLKKTEIKKSGKIPIIDQGESFISGYTDNEAYIYNCTLPIIIFGDHTRHIKYLDFKFAVGADGTKIIKPKQFYDIRFFYYYLKTLNWQHCAYGRHFKYLKQLEVPLPPLNEQKRIVAKLDKIIPRIDAVKERLEKIPLIIKRFRQSVLTAAVTGKLTEKWREENSDVERVEQKNSHCEFDIPNNWNVVHIESLMKSLKTDLRTGPFGTSLKKSEHKTEGVPVWGIESIGKNGQFINFNKIFVTVEKAKELNSFSVNGGDIIISRSGTVGELCILPGEIQYGLISTNLLKISLNQKVIMSKYFCFLFKGSAEILNKMRELCSGSTRLFLTQRILKNLEYPLPPLEEQKEIVRQVDKLFTIADKLESHYKNAKAKVEKLSQSVLAKAFRGELVIPESELAEKEGRDFESAEKLLERIIQEKEKLEAGIKKLKKKKTSGKKKKE